MANYQEDFLHPQANDTMGPPAEHLLPPQQETPQCSAGAMVIEQEPAKKFKSDSHKSELLSGLNELREHNLLCDVTLVSFHVFLT